MPQAAIIAGDSRVILHAISEKWNDRVTGCDLDHVAGAKMCSGGFHSLAPMVWVCGYNMHVSGNMQYFSVAMPPSFEVKQQCQPLPVACGNAKVLRRKPAPFLSGSRSVLHLAHEPRTKKPPRLHGDP
jgi:hypothetical protein